MKLLSGFLGKIPLKLAYLNQSVLKHSYDDDHLRIFFFYFAAWNILPICEVAYRQGLLRPQIKPHLPCMRCHNPRGHDDPFNYRTNPATIYRPLHRNVGLPK